MATLSLQVWSVINDSTTSTACPVLRLVEGNEYIFRVKAENKLGISEALESTPMIAKSPYGKNKGESI